MSLSELPRYILFRFQDFFMTRYDNLAGTNYSRFKWRILFELSGQGHSARRYHRAIKPRKRDKELLKKYFASAERTPAYTKKIDN